MLIHVSINLGVQLDGNIQLFDQYVSLIEVLLFL